MCWNAVSLGAQRRTRQHDVGRDAATAEHRAPGVRLVRRPRLRGIATRVAAVAALPIDAAARRRVPERRRQLHRAAVRQRKDVLRAALAVRRRPEDQARDRDPGARRRRSPPRSPSCCRPARRPACAASAAAHRRRTSATPRACGRACSRCAAPDRGRDRRSPTPWSSKPARIGAQVEDADDFIPAARSESIAARRSAADSWLKIDSAT